MVQNGNKADAKKRKDLLNISSRFDVVSAKAGKILYNHAVDLPRLDVLHEPGKIGTVERCSGITVVHIFPNELKILVF